MLAGGSFVVVTITIHLISLVIQFHCSSTGSAVLCGLIRRNVEFKLLLLLLGHGFGSRGTSFVELDS